MEGGVKNTGVNAESLQFRRQRHILDGATGWYMGTVQNFGVGVSWKQPDATHIVLYKKSETKLKELDGRVACRLTADNYGRSEWWLLLECMES